MALEECYECGARVSSKALQCPHCGFEFWDEGSRYPITRTFVQAVIDKNRAWGRAERKKEAEAKKRAAEAKKLAVEKARKSRENLIGCSCLIFVAFVLLSLILIAVYGTDGISNWFRLVVDWFKSVF